MTIIEHRNELGRYIGQWRTYSAIVNHVGDKFICLRGIRLLGKIEPVCVHVWVPVNSLANIAPVKGMAVAFEGKVGMHLATGERHGYGPRMTHGIEEVRSPFVLRRMAQAGFGSCIRVNDLTQIPIPPKIQNLIKREIAESDLRSVIVTADSKEYRLWLGTNKNVQA